MKRPKMVLAPGPPPPKCGKPRSKSGKVRCEYPPNHGGDHHFGRNAAGAWISWSRPIAERLAWAEDRNRQAAKLLREAYRDTHSEDVPYEVLVWLNPEVLDR